jgi:hypothetical protein
MSSSHLPCLVPELLVTDLAAVIGELRTATGVDHVLVSQYFQVGDRVLWNPSNVVAELFVRTAEALAPTADVPSGIGPREADEYQIDMAAFGAFVDALVRRYTSSRHPILNSLLEGFIATALVLVQRAGRTVTALTEPVPDELRDVSVGPAGMAAPGDAEHLRELRDEHARVMPC